MKKSLILATFLSLFVLTQWSSSMYLPIVPLIMHAFPHYEQLITASLSWFFTGYAIGQLFWGTLSDYISRYLTLTLSLICYSVAQISLALSTQAIVFIALLSFTGFATAANTAVGNALVKDFYQTQAKKIIGYIGIAMATGPAVAPLIGSHLYAWWHWQAIFIFLGITGFLILIGFRLLLANASQRTHHDKPTHNTTAAPLGSMLKDILFDKVFMHYCLILSLSFGIFFAILLIIPFWLVNLGHFGIRSVGNFIFCATLSYILGAILNVVLNRRQSILFIVLFGLTCLSVGLLIFLVNEWLTHLIIAKTNLVALVIAMLGIGIVLPASKAGAMLIRTQYIGTSASMMKFIQTLGPVIFTRFTAYTIAHHRPAAFLILLMIAILLLGILSIGLSNRSKRLLCR